jgi:uncharacterized protein (DUF2062 family)
MSWRLGRTVQILLHVDDTPHRIALAFGVGVFIAFSPLLGIHTLIALGIAFSFRLSRAAILVGTYVNNPWTLAPLYMGGTLLGCALLGVPSEGLNQINWQLHGWDFLSSLIVHLRPYLWPFVIGNTVLGTLGGLLGYFALREILLRRKRAQVASEAG